MATDFCGSLSVSECCRFVLDTVAHGIFSRAQSVSVKLPTVSGTVCDRPLVTLAGLNTMTGTFGTAALHS